MLETKYFAKLREYDVSHGTLAALISERLYQERIWYKASKEKLSEMEAIVFIDNYLQESINVVLRDSKPLSSDVAVGNIRKIAAMVLASAEKNKWEDFLIEESIRNSVIVDEYTNSKTTLEVLAILKGMVNELLSVFGSFQTDDLKVKKTMSLILMTCCFEMTNKMAVSRELTNTVDQKTLQNLLKELDDYLSSD